MANPANTLAAHGGNPVADNVPKLRDIHLPGEPGIWPLAPGWWILIAVLLVLLIWLLVKLLKRARQKRYQQKILDQYSVLEQSLLKHPDNQSIAAINTFLRQLAVNHYPRTDIASLTGNNWLAFLDKAGDTSEFTQGAGRILIDAPYQRNARDQGNASNQPAQLQNFDQRQFSTLIRNWIKQLPAKNTKKRGGWV